MTHYLLAAWRSPYQIQASDPLYPFGIRQAMIHASVPSRTRASRSQASFVHATGLFAPSFMASTSHMHSLALCLWTAVLTCC